MDGTDEKKSLSVFKRAFNRSRQEHMSEDMDALDTMCLESTFFRVRHRHHAIRHGRCCNFFLHDLV